VWHVAQLPIAESWAPRAISAVSNERVPAVAPGASPDTDPTNTPAAISDIAKPTSRLRVFMPR
jgi:hypothetical protein